MIAYTYRMRLTKEQSQSIRQLRRKGYAVVFLSPGDVGPKDRSANGTSASVGRAGRIMRSNRRS